MHARNLTASAAAQPTNKVNMKRRYASDPRINFLRHVTVKRSPCECDRSRTEKLAPLRAEYALRLTRCSRPTFDRGETRSDAPPGKKSMSREIVRTRSLHYRVRRPAKSGTPPHTRRCTRCSPASRALSSAARTFSRCLDASCEAPRSRRRAGAVGPDQRRSACSLLPHDIATEVLLRCQGIVGAAA